MRKSSSFANPTSMRLAAACLVTTLGASYACSALPFDAEDQVPVPMKCEGSCGGEPAGMRLAEARHSSRGGGPATGSAAVPPVYDSAHLDDAEAFAVAHNDFAVVVPYVSERLDQMGQFDPTTHRFTSTHGDYYLVCASLASASGAEFELDLFINDVRGQALSTSQSGKAQGCRTIRLEAGQYVDVRAISTESSGTTFASNPRWNWLSISYASGDTSLYDNPAFVIPTATFTTVPYQTALYGSAPGGVFTSRYFGNYRICASMATFGQIFELDLFIDGQRDRAFALARNGKAQGCVTTRLSPGQVLDVRAFHYGSPVTVSPDPIWNWMTVDDLLSARLSPRLAGPFSAASGQPTVLPTSVHTITGQGEDTVCASLASFTGALELDLYINGNFDKAIAWSSIGAATGCRTVHVWPGNVVDVRVLQTTGTTMAFPANGHWSWVESFTY